MLACWQSKPESRPTMKTLHQDLKLFGSDDMTNTYADYRLDEMSFNDRCTRAENPGKGSQRFKTFFLREGPIVLAFKEGGVPYFWVSLFASIASTTVLNPNTSSWP